MTILFALALAAQAALPPASAPPQIDAQTVAAAMQPRLPQRFAADFALVAAAAEGNVLVLTFEVGAAMLQAATPDSISAQLSQGFCAAGPARAALEGPMSLRAVARTADGQVLQGAVIDRCPAAAG